MRTARDLCPNASHGCKLSCPGAEGAFCCTENPSALTVVSLLFPLCSAALKGTWQSGFFDQGSFQEIMRPWAQTVVVGRARYCWVQGGLPCPYPALGRGGCKHSYVQVLCAHGAGYGRDISGGAGLQHAGEPAPAEAPCLAAGWEGSPWVSSLWRPALWR